MRIAMLHVDLPTTGRGGVSYQVHRLANSIAGRHEVVVFSFSPPPADARYEVRGLSAVPEWVPETKVGRFVGTPIAFALERYAEFDLVHAHGDSQFLYRRSIPVVRTFYGSAREEARYAVTTKRRVAQHLLTASERLARRTATVAVGISENAARSLGGVDCVIPCGVDRTRFRPGMKSEAPSILFVGTVRGRKRGHLVLDAFERYVRPRIPECELWFVGEEPDSRPGVRVFGKVSDDTIELLFREAWLVTLPSTYEGFGVPYVEAMASGTAVVATPNAGAREVLPPQSGGIIVPDRELASTLVGLLLDHDRRRELESRGRSFSEPYDWDLVAERYEQVYEKALTVRR
jgi:glycosyltransferase involved in cell wall biosynthesis